MLSENFDEKKYFYHYGNGSSSNAIPILDMEIPYLSKCISHLQPRSHGTCDSIGIYGAFVLVGSALDMSDFEFTKTELLLGTC